jgi:hypothetical protein
VKKITEINDGKQSVPEIVAASSCDTENDDDQDVNMHRQSASDKSSLTLITPSHARLSVTICY